MRLRLACLAAALAGFAQHAAAMKVIGLGPGRTGTESLKVALIELGFGPTYHMRELLFEDQGVSTSGHMAMWEAAANGEAVDFRTMLAQFNSGTDFPISALPDEMLAAFPDAKFVLSMRPPAKWWSSIQSTICWFHAENNIPFKVLLKLPVFPFSRILEQKSMVDAMSLNKLAYGDAQLSSWNAFCAPENRERTLAAFDRHMAHVKKLIPQEQLLIFDPSVNTYAELAAFLGVEPPRGKKFPHVNSKAEFQSLQTALSVAALLVVAVPLVVVSWVLRRFWRRGSSGGAGARAERKAD